MAAAPYSVIDIVLPPLRDNASQTPQSILLSASQVEADIPGWIKSDGYFPAPMQTVTLGIPILLFRQPASANNDNEEVTAQPAPSDSREHKQVTKAEQTMRRFVQKLDPSLKSYMGDDQGTVFRMPKHRQANPDSSGRGQLKLAHTPQQPVISVASNYVEQSLKREINRMIRESPAPRPRTRLRPKPDSSCQQKLKIIHALQEEAAQEEVASAETRFGRLRLKRAAMRKIFAVILAAVA